MPENTIGNLNEKLIPIGDDLLEIEDQETDPVSSKKIKISNLPVSKLVDQDLKTTASPNFSGLTILDDGDGLTVHGTATIDDQIELVGACVKLLTLTDSISAASASAIDGDTLILASGLYTLTATPSSSKIIGIKGQGQGKTILACATDSIYSLHSNNVSNRRFSDLTVNCTANTPRAIYFLGTGGDVITGCIAENIDINVASTGSFTGVYIREASGRVNNLKIAGTCGSGNLGAFYIRQESTAEAPTTFLIENCETTLESTASSNVLAGVYVLDTAATQDAIVTLRNSKFKTTKTSTASVYGAYANGGDAYIYAENCIFDGADADVGQTASAIVQLTNCVLMNGTTSGIITYKGTLVNENYYCDKLLKFAAATTNSVGLLFGTDTNLYRSAANTLKTDDTFHAAGYKSSDGTTGSSGTITIAGLTSITVKNGLITGWS